MTAENYSVDYAITLTTYGKFRKLDPGDQFDKLVDVFKLFPGFIKKTLVAECHQDYTIHIHGVYKIDMSKIPSKYRRCPRKIIYDLFRDHKFVGHMKIIPVIDYNQWNEYLAKNLSDTYNAIHRYPVIHDDYNIFENTTVFDLQSGESFLISK